MGHDSYRAGVTASLIAEIVFMAMVAMVSMVRGMDPWMVTRVPASFLLGPSAVAPPGFVPAEVGLGMVMHIAMAIVVGLIFSALRPRLRLKPVIAGLITGAILYGLGFWTLPLLFPNWLSPFWLPATGRMLQAVAHAVYGVTFGVAYGRLTERIPP